jgi:uncharacterized membrane protein YeaQ/YmgE (transglycosylase-associated protein family)
MGILGYLIVGLICGALAKAILPGRQGGGWIATIILGVVGAIVGGFVGGLVFNIRLGTFFDFRTWALALVGSLIVLAIWGLVTRRRA